jgi:hypothetical protein
MAAKTDVTEGTDVNVADALEWAYLDGFTEERLLAEMDESRDELDDAMNDHMNLVRCCMARLTQMHLARA